MSTQRCVLDLELANAPCQAHLSRPPASLGLVILAHGGRSTGSSPRTIAVAERLESSGFATLRIDLLTEEERVKRGNIFDVELLRRRLRNATEWARGDARVGDLTIGYFGSSTGAAAALLCAADDDRIFAVVSRGGRGDLVGIRAREIVAPTLLIVGSRDGRVLSANRALFGTLNCESRLDLIDGAGHDFHEPGAFEEVGRIAGDWFGRWSPPTANH
ncbi:MAG: dienelactone hydrolase family protein [Phycisphaerales bacterium]|nr:dienelactone hydrolase family protein [Phycisphaerales bacterium]